MPLKSAVPARSSTHRHRWTVLPPFLIAYPPICCERSTEENQLEQSGRRERVQQVEIRVQERKEINRDRAYDMSDIGISLRQSV